MPVHYKRLGQQVSDDTGEIRLVVAALPDTEIVVSTLFVCNLTDEQASFSIRVGQDASTAHPSEYLFFGTPIPARTTLTATSGITLDPGYVIYIDGTPDAVAFSAFGQEVTP